MSTKASILSTNHVHFYEECFDDNNVYIQVSNLDNAIVAINDDCGNFVTAIIPNKIMDDMAVKWCSKRNLTVQV